MLLRLTDGVHDLELGQALSLDHAHNRTIRCEEALLWITQQGSIQDILLAPGESRDLSNARRVVIQALGGKARFSLQTNPGLLERLANRLRTLRLRLARRRGGFGVLG